MNARDDLESAQDVPVSVREDPVSVHDDYGRHRMAKDMPTGLESGYTPTKHDIFTNFRSNLPIFNLLF